MKKLLLFTLAGCALVFSSFGYHGCCHRHSYKSVLAHCGWHRHSSRCKSSPRRDNRNCNDRNYSNRRGDCDSSYRRGANCKDNSNYNNRPCQPCR